jgi:TonB-linked SusC/RagA family outer membrane protein
MKKRSCIEGHLIIILILYMFHTPLVTGQVEKISLTGAPSNLAALFSFIQEKSGYRFFYKNDLVNPDAKITLSSDQLTLTDLIKELSVKTGLNFRIMENKIIVVEDARIQTKITVKGKVTSKLDNSPLPGVNVLNKGTLTGVITNADGSYEITVSSNATLVFSFIGFKSEEIAVQGMNVIDVAIEEDIETLGEVVVTALNIKRTKNSLGYSVSTVSGDDLNQNKDNNVINTLAGKVAGLQISKSSTGVDGSSRVILRGVASLLGDNRPLIVVDGIPVYSGHGGGTRWGGTDTGDGLSDINPEDIENISILKGTGAAAAYGSRGANGVILITTKKGSGKKGLGVSLTTNYSFDNPLLYPDLQNKYGHGAFGTYPTTVPDGGFPWGWSWGPKMEGQILPNFFGTTSAYSPQPDNYKDFFQTGHSLTNTLTIDGGNEKSNVRASFSNQNSSGIVPTNDLARQTINLRGFSKMKDILEFDGKITYIHSKVNNRPDVAEGGNNPGYFLSIMPRNMVLNDLHTHMQKENGNEQLWTTDSYTCNPYWQLYNTQNDDEKHRLQGVFSAKAIINPSFNIELRSGMDYSDQSYHSHVARGSYANNYNGAVNNSFFNYLEWNSDFMANYRVKVTEGLNLSLSSGGNYRYNTSKGISQSGSSLRINDYFAISNCATYSTDQDFSEKAVYSVYGLGQVTYLDYLYFDFTLRNDWSSTLPVDNNSYFYHSENLSFLFTNALKIKSDILTTGKLRASFSRVGNDTDPYKTKQYYDVNQSALSYPLGSFSDVLASYNLQPEITNSWEAGTNLAFFKNLIVFDLTYYHTVSNNQIMDISLPPASGFSSMRTNAASLQNKGVEIQIDVSPLRRNKLTWDLTLTWSKNKSLIKKLYGDTESIILDDSWIGTLQARPGDEYGSVYAYDYKRDNLGRKLIDDNGYAIAGEYKKMGSINPDWVGSISNKFSYKGFAFSFLIDVHKGGNVVSMGRAYRDLFGTSARSLEGRDEWYSTHNANSMYTSPLDGIAAKGFIESGINENTGQTNTIPVEPMNRWYNLWSSKIDKEWILDATNVRLREVTLSYSLPKQILASTPLDNVQLSIVARNVFFFYNAMNDIDPESGYSSGNTGGGFEHNAIPTTRSIGFNIKVGF